MDEGKTPPAKITQAMIDAYDEYTHLTLDRRGFMEKLTRLAGTATAAAAIAPLLAANSAQAALIAPDDARITAQTISYPGSQGAMKAYLALPKSPAAKLGGVVVIHENRGLNDHIRDIARRMAVEGFVALAPDLLSFAGGTPDDEDKARDMIGKLDPSAALADTEATRKHLASLAETNGKTGAIGFCWGGGMVNRLAVAAPDLAAGIAYYGAQPKPEEVAKIHAALMLHYAGLDERINAGIEAYRKALTENGKRFEIFVYDGVNHAFNNDTSAARYDKAAAELAWSRSIAFLKRELA